MDSKPLSKKPPTPQEFAQLPRVLVLVRRYERRPHIEPDAQRDLAAWAELTLKLHAPDVAVMVGLVVATDGGPPFESRLDGPVALHLRKLQQHPEILTRLAQAPGAPRRAGNKPNLARRALVLGLAHEWELLGLKVAISKNAAALSRGESASGPFVRACVAATCNLPAHLRLTPEAVANEIEAHRRQSARRLALGGQSA